VVYCILGTGVCCQYLFSGYITRFLFTLCTCDAYDHEDDNNRDNTAVQPPERTYSHREELFTIDVCKSDPCQSHSSLHNQSTDDNDDSLRHRNKHSLVHVYDDDGDLIVKRKCRQQFEIIYIG